MKLNPDSRLSSLLTFVVMLLLSGCASVYKPHNTPIKSIDNQQGYRVGHNRNGDTGEHLVWLAFSGGGTRAAALSYGVLKALRDSPIMDHGQQVRLLDEVDNISSVSGGSFTSAYYGLFGDRIFTDYEKAFLKKSVQGVLIAKLFDPTYWWKTVFSNFDRTEMAIEYYDNNIFEGKTFRDMRLNGGPFVEINATDLGGGNRFAFIQAYFDTICSDLNPFPVARAVTASSAVPIAFPPVVLQNFSGQCDPLQSTLLKYVTSRKSDDPRLMELQSRIRAYMDQKKHPYIHLVDGGVSDNLGLRMLMDRIDSMGNSIDSYNKHRWPKDVLLISVDAEVIPDHSLDEKASKPSMAETFESFSDAQFRLFNNETRILMDRKLEELQQFFKDQGHPVNVYKANVSFAGVAGKSLRSRLNSLPTALELPEGDVDLLTAIGSDLLKNSSGFKQFMAANRESPSAAQ